MRQSGALAVLFAFSVAAPVAAGGPVSAESFYALKTTTLQGQPADLSQYKGKVALVVNVASQCGLTPQYTGLQKLYDELKGKGFVVLGFPSNDFGGQEPGTPRGDRGLLPEELRRDVPDVLQARDEGGPGSVARSTATSARPARCRPGTSPSTSSTRTARWSSSSTRR